MGTSEPEAPAAIGAGADTAGALGASTWGAGVELGALSCGAAAPVGSLNSAPSEWPLLGLVVVLGGRAAAFGGAFGAALTGSSVPGRISIFIGGAPSRTPLPDALFGLKPAGSTKLSGLLSAYAYLLNDCPKSGNATSGSGVRKRRSAGS